MLPPFVDDLYLQTVLLPAEQTGVVPDECRRYGLSYGLSSQIEAAEIEARIDRVYSYWTTVTTAGALINSRVLTRLIGDHEVVKGKLLSLRSRKRLVEDLMEAQRARLDRARWTLLEQVQDLQHRGRVPTQALKRAINIKALARYFQLYLDEAQDLLDEFDWTYESATEELNIPLSLPVITEIQTSLRALESFRRDWAIRAVGRSIYSFLGVRSGERDQRTLETALDDWVTECDLIPATSLSKEHVVKTIENARRYLVQDPEQGIAYRKSLAALIRSALTSDVLALIRPPNSEVGRRGKESLICKAIDLGISKQRTLQFVDEVVHTAGAHFEDDEIEPADYDLCMVCQMSTNAGGASCEHCGSMTNAPCPNDNCSIPVAAEMTSCPSCDLDLRFARNAGFRARCAEDALNRACLGEAEILCGPLRASKLPAIEAIVDKIDGMRRSVNGLLTEADAAAMRVHWFRARTLWQEVLEISHEETTTLFGSLADAIAAADTAIVDATLRLMNEPLTEISLASFLTQCADHPRLLEWLSCHAPTPPPLVAVVTSSEGLRVTWDRSPDVGVSTYTLMREFTKGSPATREHNDLGQYEEREVLDCDLSAGAIVEYSVWANRANRKSEVPARGGPVVYLPEPTGIRLSSRPGSVSLRWHCPPSVVPFRTQIWRDPPFGCPEKQIETTESSFDDREVEGGVTYRYTLRMTYQCGEGPRESDGVTRAVYVPTEYRIVERLEVEHNVDGTITAWIDEPASDDVALMIATESFPYVKGEEVAAVELQKDVREIISNPGRVSFPEPVGGSLLRLVAASRYDDIYVVGTETIINGAPSLSAVRLEPWGRIVRVSIPWDELPQGIVVQLAWDFDHPPESFSLTSAEHSRVLYRSVAFEGIPLDGDSLYVLAATVIRSGNSLVYGPSISCRLDLTMDHERS